MGSFHDDSVTYTGRGGSAGVLACGPPNSDAAKAPGRSLLPVSVEVHQGAYERRSRAVANVPRCEDGSLGPLVKTTAKDDGELAQIVEP